MNPWVIVTIVVILVVAAVVLLVRRREPDSYGTFHRQIDALSPEARRPVVEQVKEVADTSPTVDQPEDRDEPAGDAGSDGREADDDQERPDGA